MSCYHPLKAFPIGLTENGKTKYKIVGNAVDHIEDVNGMYYPVMEKYNQFGIAIRDYIEIPCGKCIGCRLDYSRTWANRMMLELKDHETAYFVTLTYNDEHVPISYYPDPETGEAIEVYTLSKRDVQLFFKRLRKAGQVVRYFLAGEYGNMTFRPHYHAIIYGLRLDDLKPLKRTKGGLLYTSEFLERTWQKGLVAVAEVTWETCAYTARYVTKKLKGDLAEFYKIHNIVPEFALMSRKPGLARKYYDENKDKFYATDTIIISTDKGGLKFKPPKYFDCLYELDNPEEYGKIKAKRRMMAEAHRKLKLSKTDLNYYELLSVEENIKKRQLEALPRKEF